MKRFFLLFCNLITLHIYSQNERDIKIHETIYPNLYTDYDLVKSEILKLEENYGYEAHLKYILINQSFENSDLDFFKAELSILVREYGFNLAYEPEYKAYYIAITAGELAVWFKDMYLKNHFIWLNNNFLKQADLRKLNRLKDKTVTYNSINHGIQEVLILDGDQKEAQNTYFADAAFSNLAELYELTRKLDMYPTAKNFALVQNSFDLLVYQNLSTEPNFERTWLLFEPFYRKAYQNHTIDYIIYKNYDLYSFIHYKNQRYGLISIFDIPEAYQNNLFSIPIRDSTFANKMKTYFNWKND